MIVCFIDEAGCTGELTNPNIQPLLAVGAIFVSASDIPQLTRGFLALKTRYFPQAGSTGRRHFLDGVLSEVKGAEVRKDIRQGPRPSRRRAIGFLDDMMDLMEGLRVRVVAGTRVRSLFSTYLAGAGCFAQEKSPDVLTPSPFRVESP